jgi:hypothetical protein
MVQPTNDQPVNPQPARLCAASAGGHAAAARACVPGDESEMLAVMKSFDKKAEKMVVILGSMNEGIKSVKGDTSQMIEKQDVRIKKQDQMLDKQDKSIATGHKIR